MKELQQKLAIAAPAKTAEAATPIDVETTPTLSTDRPSAIEKHLTTFLGFFQLKK